MDAKSLTTRSMEMVRPFLFATAAWLICCISLTGQQGIPSAGTMEKLGNIFLPQAFAEEGEGSGSTDCLVCVPLADTTLGTDIYTGSDSTTNPKNGDHMVSMCHTAGGSSNLVSLSVDYDSIPAFLDQGDALGACTPGVYVNTCAAMTSSGTVTGIWIPSSAVGNSTAQNTYFNNIQSGVASGLQTCSTTGASQNYRDIHGQ